MRVGIVGCGNISEIYFDAPKKFPMLTTVACTDLIRSRAEEKARKHGVRRVLTTDELVHDPEVDIVLNLTIPSAHYSLCTSALEAGKHVYVEKPLSLLRDEGEQLVQFASERGLRIGCAPDTFLGAGLQTSRKLIDDGAIGFPVAFDAHMMGHGPERWHPDPEFFYKNGAGPLFDMGPYYLTALIAILGPIANVTATSRISFPEREIGSGPKQGQKIAVETPTHVAGVVEFHSGVVGTLTTSFDVWSSEAPGMEIYGSEGTLSLPDPNSFGGPVRLRRKGESNWVEIPLTHGYDGNSRGIGMAEMALAIAENRPHRACGDLANHVLEAMHGFLISSADRKHYMMTTEPSQPAPLPRSWPG